MKPWQPLLEKVPIPVSPIVADEDKFETTFKTLVMLNRSFRDKGFLIE